MTPNIPKHRPAGSPLASRYGATDFHGNPVRVVPVKKAVWTRQPRAYSPNERAGITVPDGGRAAAHAALSLLFAGPVAVQKAKAKAKPPVAVYNASGELVGYTDQANITAVAAGSAPAAPRSHVGDPAAQAVPVQKRRGPTTAELLLALGRASGSNRVQKSRAAQLDEVRRQVNANVRAGNLRFTALQTDRSVRRRGTR